MEFNALFLKEWFTLNEINLFLRKKYQIDITNKSLLKHLFDNHLASFYLYIEGKDGKIIINKKSVDGRYYLNDYMPNETAKDEGSLAQLIEFAKTQQTPIIISRKYTKISLIYESEELKLLEFSGLFSLSSLAFNDSYFLFSDENNLYLPENDFYFSEELLTNPANPETTYNFGFIHLQFNHAIGQGLISVDDIKVEIPGYKMQELIDYFEQISTPQPPKTEKTIKTVKNKSNEKSENRTPRNKKDFFTPLILASINATAKAYPDLGGYQIVNAVLDTLKDKQGFKTSDLYTVEGYLGKYKRTYNATFPRNSGRHKAQITAIITEPAD
ncbi:MAG: hypothetical protein E7K78_01820 [Haemophilus haemolyticus]|jgi:hypothetical protein|nr:hypothetical protein [Haemophilus haemolyticus]DAR40077.1 MAG TPA: hypothetical protein [Caudoviricetes sp.]